MRPVLLMLSEQISDNRVSPKNYATPSYKTYQNLPIVQ
jgi:hypothetical protein